jgi:hypothetical protein
MPTPLLASWGSISVKALKRGTVSTECAPRCSGKGDGAVALHRAGSAFGRQAAVAVKLSKVLGTLSLSLI